VDEAWSSLWWRWPSWSRRPSLAVGEEIRGLLRDLSIQAPSREVNAPPLSLPDTSGEPVRLADHKGRAVMIYFWTTY
jgi:hypothetical protein